MFKVQNISGGSFSKITTYNLRFHIIIDRYFKLAFKEDRYASHL